MASGAPSTPAPVPSTPAPKSELHDCEAQETEEEQEWDMNNPQHCCEILESRFPYDDMVKCNVKISEFTKISMFYIESLKRRAPKAPLSHYFLKDFDGITSTRQKRMDWLTSWGKQRRLQFMPKPVQPAKS